MDPIGFATRELRRRRPLAHRRRERHADRRVGRPARRQHVRRAWPGCGGAAAASRLFVATMTEKLLTYALGRGSSTTTRRPCARSSPAPRDDDYRFSSHRRRDRQSMPFQMQEDAMIVTKKALCPAHVPARIGRHAGAAAARCDGAGAVRARADAAAPVAPPRVRLYPDGRRHAVLDARGRRARSTSSRRLLAPLDAVPRSRHGRSEPRAQERDLPVTRNHATANCTFLSGVPAKRTEGTDYYLGHHRRPDRRAADRQGDAAALARARRPIR